MNEKQMPAPKPGFYWCYTLDNEGNPMESVGHPDIVFVRENGDILFHGYDLPMPLDPKQYRLLEGLEYSANVVVDNDALGRQLKWRYDGSGEWEAFSTCVVDDVPFMWRIKVSESGEFSINSSDLELRGREISLFLTLGAAKAFCETADATSLLMEQ